VTDNDNVDMKLLFTRTSISHMNFKMKQNDLMRRCSLGNRFVGFDLPHDEEFVFDGCKCKLK
jgi:hypothetical protein